MAVGDGVGDGVGDVVGGDRISWGFTIGTMRIAIKTTAQDEATLIFGVIDCIRKTLANEGFSGLFAGVTLALPQTAGWFHSPELKLHAQPFLTEIVWKMFE